MNGFIFRPMDRPERGPRPLQVAEDIVPIAELKAHLSEVVRTLRERGRPIVVTQHGKAAAVVLSPDDYDRLSYQARFASAVAEGLDDERAGRLHSHAEVAELLDAKYGRKPKARKK